MSYLLRVLILTSLLSACGGGGNSSGSDEEKTLPKEYFTVSTQASTGGTISPSSLDVEKGKSASFEISVDEGFILDEVSGCNGQLEGLVYTTSPLSEDCQISLTFNETYTVSGNAQLGMVVNAVVKLFELPSNKLISQTTTSSSSSEHGAFRFDDIVIDEHAYYLVTVDGGQSLDPNLDGVAEDSEALTIQGAFSAIATGTQLSQYPIQVSALTDIQTLYVKTAQGQYLVESSNELDAIAEQLVKDVTGDGSVEALDVLLFDPQVHQQQLLVSHPTLLNSYTQNIYEAYGDDRKLFDVFSLLPPEISIEGGLLNKIPFVLSANLTDLPHGVSIQWRLDGESIDLEEDPEIQTTGSKLLSAVLSFNNTEVTEIQKTFTAFQTETLTEKVISPTDGGVIAFDTTELSTDYDGTKIIIPAGALNQQQTISINSNTAEVIPTTNGSLSPVATFEPSGLTFLEPVTIALPVNQLANINDINSIRVARTDEQGVVDYLTPTKLDNENSLVYFTTTHFSSYVVINKEVKDLLTDGIGDPLLKSAIKDIEQRFTEEYDGVSNSEWLSYLSTEIADIDNKTTLTVYDAYLSAVTAEKVKSEISRDEEPSSALGGPYRGYSAAFKAMYGETAVPKGGVLSEWEFAKEMISSPGNTLVEHVEKKYFKHASLSRAYYEFKSAEGSVVDARDFVADVYNSTFPFDLSELNVVDKLLGVYKDNLLSVGGKIVSDFSDIKVNWQIRNYFSLREQGYSPSALIGALNSNTEIDVWSTDSGWFSATSYMPSGTIPSNFWEMVEGLYISSISAETSKDQFKTLLDAAIALENLEEPKNSFYLSAYQINELDTEYFEDRFDRSAIEVTSIKDQSFVLNFTLQLEGDNDYLSSFDPEFSIEASDSNCIFCDDLAGLSYQMVSAQTNAAGDQSFISIEFTYSGNAQEVDYEFDFSYQSSFSDVFNDGRRLTIKIVEENSAPMANILAPGGNVFSTGESIELIADASDDDGVIASYSWHIFTEHDITYDDNSSTLNFVAPNVADSETFDVLLIVTDDGGKETSESVTLTVNPMNNTPPEANAGSNQIVGSGDSVTLSGSLSSDVEDSNEQLEYLWQQVDGSDHAVAINQTNSEEAHFTAPNVAVSTVLTFRLTVTDSENISDTSEVEITVLPSNSQPVANAGEEQSVFANSEVTLDGSASFDQETAFDSLSFEWRQIDDSVHKLDIENSDSVNSSFVAPEVSTTTTFTIELLVIDASGEQASDTVDITVQPSLKELEPIFISISPTNVMSNATDVTFTVTGENFPQTLAMALEDSASCTDISVKSSSSASVTCDIPDTSKNELAFYIKDKPGEDGGSIISGAENVVISVSTGNDIRFIQPCRDCGYSGPYDRDWHGDGTSHLAKDYPAFVGDNVVSIARGQVVKILSDAAGFGGAEPSLPGGAVVLMHTKANGDNFFALYGHINAVNDLTVDDVVEAGEVIGTVHHYYVGTESGLEDWPHLHFGIWDAEDSFPTTNLGYGEVRSFVDPVPFLVDTQPELLTEAIDLTPVSATVGASTSFTLTGENIPSSIAMSLAGSESCGSVYGVTTTQAQIDCTPLTSGVQQFYVKNKAGGVFLRGSENMQVDVQIANQENLVLGIAFSDPNFAQCVQEHVEAQLVDDLADLNTLDCRSRSISDVNELSYMTGLVTLYLQNNVIVEINLDENQSIESADLLNNDFSQSSLEYLASVNWITSLNYKSDEPPQDDSGAFITTWQVEAGQQITIPTNSNFTYDYQVDWGDGSAVTSETGDASHTYEEADTYTVKITGVFPAIYFYEGGGNHQSIASIEQWGSIQWLSMEGAFAFCSNLTLNAVDIPNLDEVTDLSDMFRLASSFNGDLSNWNVGTIIDMSSMFESASNFNGDLSTWDVSNVTNMERMFLGAFSFNSDISEWNVSNVTKMKSMFGSAYGFNRDLSSWNVSNVTNMSYMFDTALSFNGNISSWNVSSVTDMSYMFFSATDFNGNLSSWNVSNVTNMRSMFSMASNFNGNLSKWNTQSVTNMAGMFADNPSFDNDISQWNVSKVTNMLGMFSSATSFNGDLSNWDVSNVTDMERMFSGAHKFSGDLSQWDVQNVTNMAGMFSASSFNSDISNWNVSSVTDMSYMFASSAVFNQDLSAWDVSKVTDMQYMFKNALRFNSNISNWDVSSVTNMRSMFANSQLILSGAQSDFNQNLSGWNVVNVSNMDSMFSGATSFNGDLSNWDVSSVTEMYGMFADAQSFNQDLSTWDVSNVVNMSSMFSNAISFNSNISNWDVSSVTAMDYMFNQATNAAMDLSGWNVSSNPSHISFSEGSQVIEPDWP